MITIALHNNDLLADESLGDVVRSIAFDASGQYPSILRFEGPIDLVDMLSSSEENLVDLVILPYELPGMTGIETVREARGINPFLKAIVIAPSIEHAANAAAHSIDGYLVEPVTNDSFSRTLDRIIRRIMQHHVSSTLISSREGVKRVVFDQVLYCETSGHNQIIHFLDGSTLTTRCSSQSMFDSLSSDSRFFKAGSSYIVNLYEVTQALSGKGVVVLSDGRELNVPARLRKTLETSLLDLAVKETAPLL